MKVLALNAGTATLKFAVTDLPSQEVSASGTLDGIGGPAAIHYHTDNSADTQPGLHIEDHADAVRAVITDLEDQNHLRGLCAVGHRVVHGGQLFVGPTRIVDPTLRQLESLTDLAPLHNGPAVASIRQAREILGSKLPMVATFDTAFHTTLPRACSHYAIPMELSLRHGIRRYGFHGLAHRSMLHLYAQTASQSASALRVITLQLGAGCSATAIDRGRSVETSMGLTPLEGLVMATRSGDVDPALISYLAKRENVDSQTVDGWLNRRSGLFGLSGGISDMRYLVELADAGNDNASLAIEIFCHRVRKYIGAYLATLGGADAICFGGGIGENAWPVRKRILEGLEGIGLDYDHARNLCAIGGGRLVKDKSPIDARVISVNEEVLITKDTVDCLGLAID